jgi:GAF domain-containing protein
VLDGRDFTELVVDAVDAPDTERSAEHVARLARTAVGCDHAGVMVLYPRRAVDTVAATDPSVDVCDRLQLELNEGPCLDAITEQHTLLACDVGADPRWPQWGPWVAGVGFGSVLSVRLFTHQRTVGALNLYATEPRDFDDDDVATALLFAQHASAALALSLHHEQLEAAVEARHHIGLAQGILMERYGLDSDAAFEVLRRCSRDTNRKLRDVATEVIDGLRRDGPTVPLNRPAS